MAASFSVKRLVSFQKMGLNTARLNSNEWNYGIEYNMHVLISPTTFLILRGVERDIVRNYIGVHAKWNYGCYLHG